MSPSQHLLQPFQLRVILQKRLHRMLVRSTPAQSASRRSGEGWRFSLAPLGTAPCRCESSPVRSQRPLSWRRRQRTAVQEFEMAEAMHRN